MEILLGIILLLQVFALIQLMRIQKQMLQKMNKQSEELNIIIETFRLWRNNEEKKRTSLSADASENSFKEQEKEAALGGTSQKDAQEALLNEVLSEIFS